MQEVWELVQLYDLAVDLSERMNDPNRLFTARGNTLFKEERDRKRVRLIPKISQGWVIVPNNLSNLCFHCFLLYGDEFTCFDNSGNSLKSLSKKVFGH
jgi:hypothetical protein